MTPEAFSADALSRTVALALTRRNLLALTLTLKPGLRIVTLQPHQRVLEI